MGRPWSSSASQRSAPETSGAGCWASMTARLPGATDTPATSSASPRKTYSARVTPGDAGGRVQRAPGSRFSVQIATSASSLAAHESGGGAPGARPSRAPATVITSVTRPASSVKRWTGTPSRHSILKYGATILCACGRLSQI